MQYLQVDKNNIPIYPVARYMMNGIESKRLVAIDVKDTVCISLLFIRRVESLNRCGVERQGGG